MHDFIQKAVDWFTTFKVPDLKDKTTIGLESIKNNKPLEGDYKKVFGFILFDYCMHSGPTSFIDAEEAAEEIGVTDQFKYYAEDWINYSKQNQKQ